ncbi:GNAT family N-acetyltransferase [Psychrobacter pygoscelis]|uniref:GNAT family N-acetyltransferase n=1 Tax=Psychrobacter pygoscelis TaxID=2488563 RepID=UPI00103E8F91|nr:GNAT family N-acetyltransferase [Psychrobacter pygoscelis]
MQNYRVRLESPVSTSFRCQKAADSLDIDVAKKSVHELSVDADITTPFNVGLIVGASGSGKTTLAKQIFGDEVFDFKYDPTKPVIEQFPDDMSYDECAKLLSGIGLTSVPCWIRPIYTLSNGQTARAIAALQMASSDVFVVDEWTSVVDRTVAKAMSNCLQKFARKNNKTVIALSCHYDVFEWLNPDWMIDCNKQEYVERRLLWQDYKRQERLEFTIRECDSKSWKYFSKYHYLSQTLPFGHVRFYGMYHNNEQIGFICYANYVPYQKNKGKKMQMHFNRVVIHPDYVGLGLGEYLINETAREMSKQGFDVRSKFSSVPTHKILQRTPKLWKLINVQRFAKINTKGTNRKPNQGFRDKVKTYSYQYLG